MIEFIKNPLMLWNGKPWEFIHTVWLISLMLSVIFLAGVDKRRLPIIFFIISVGIHCISLFFITLELFSIYM